MITVRTYQEETDYPIFAKWWEGHDFQPVPPHILPTLGNVVLKDGEPIAAAWLYLDSSTPVAMMEWIVTDPANNPKVSAVGITHAVQSLKSAAFAAGYPIILSSCRQESLARLLERTGFERSDEGVTHLISIVNQE